MKRSKKRNNENKSHYVLQEEPPQGEHSNGVGVILHDHYGRKLQGATGPMNNLCEQQGLSSWGIQVGIIQAYNMGFYTIEVEAVSRDVYDIINFQDFIVVSEALSRVITQFNTRHAYQYEEGETECFQFSSLL